MNQTDITKQKIRMIRKISNSVYGLPEHRKPVPKFLIIQIGPVRSVVKKFELGKPSTIELIENNYLMLLDEAGVVL